LAIPFLATASVANTEVWKAVDIRTVIRFYPEVLRDLDLDVVEMKSSSSPVRQHPLSVLKEQSAPAFSASQPWSMTFRTQDGHFEGSFSGAARHQGGFALVWRGGKIALHGFTIRPGREPRTLEVVTESGRVVFLGTHLHWAVDPEAGRIEMFNVDLRLTRNVALSLGREALAGKTVGVLSLSASVEGPGLSIPEAGAVPNCNDWSGDQDVALINVGSVSQRARADGQVVMTPSATLKNVGTANVPWYSKFSGFNPPYNNDQHPFLTWSAFRVTDEAIHQLGVSDIKHAFLTLNFSCTAGACTDGHILGLGCEDVYGFGTNSSNFDLAYREEILAASGVWAHCNEPKPATPSHFDPNGDCSSGDFSPAGEDYFTHGLVVQESDLADDSASYFFSAWYLIRDDIDIFNTMGYRQIDPVFSGSSWTFGFLSPLVNGSPVNTWIPLGTDEPDRSNETLALGLGNGNLQLATSVTDLGDGYYRYEYALMNHDFDQGLDGFSVPLAPGISVRSAAFRDIDQDSGNDWTQSIDSDAVRWQSPDRDSFQPWGTLYNFTLEADTLPETGTAILDVSGDYVPAALEIESRAPGPAAIFSDGFETGDVSSWSEALP